MGIVALNFSRVDLFRDVWPGRNHEEIVSKKHLAFDTVMVETQLLIVNISAKYNPRNYKHIKHTKKHQSACTQWLGNMELLNCSHSL